MRFVLMLAFTVLFTFPNGQAHNYKKVCYFANWAYYRTGAGKYWINNLDPYECTHLVYGFAVINNSTWEMRVFDEWIDLTQGGYSGFNGLKQINRNLKTLIALGGWNDSHFTMSYSDLVATDARIDHFVAQATDFVRYYGFDGLDFDWEYPGDPGRPEDKSRFIILLQKLRRAFDQYGLLLTIAPSCSVARAQVSYDIAALAEIVDFVNFMAYDIHGSWESQVDHHAPLYKRSWDGIGSEVISEGVEYWLSKGFPPNKLIFGIPAYGRTFTLANANQHDILASAIGPGPNGTYTNEPGFTSFYEICLNIQQGWSVVTDPLKSNGPYAYQGTTWVGWDDIDTVVLKVNYAMNRGLGGIMLWELSLDDFNNFCGYGARPVMRAVEETLSGNNFATPSTTVKPVQCTSNGAYYADPVDCTKYYRCVSGEIIIGYCPPNLAFNQETTACDFPQNVDGCH